MYEQGEAFPSAARTATPTAVVVPVPPDATIIEVTITTSAASTPSTVVNIDFPDAGTGAFATSFLATAAITATGTARLRVGPGVASTANVSAPASLPGAIRIRPVHGNGNSHTYAIAYHFR